MKIMKIIWFEYNMVYIKERKHIVYFGTLKNPKRQ